MTAVSLSLSRLVSFPSPSLSPALRPPSQFPLSFVRILAHSTLLSALSQWAVNRPFDVSHRMFPSHRMFCEPPHGIRCEPPHGIRCEPPHVPKPRDPCTLSQQAVNHPFIVKLHYAFQVRTLPRRPPNLALPIKQSILHIDEDFTRLCCALSLRHSIRFKQFYIIKVICSQGKPARRVGGACACRQPRSVFV